MNKRHGSRRNALLIAACMVPLIGAAPAHALEKVKVAASFVGLWDTSQPTFCKERGEFEKAGLDVEIVSTRGGSETVQAVLVGGMDIAYSPGVNAVLAATKQGAKFKIISSEFVGQNDTLYYVDANSPLKTAKDLAGKTVGFPRPGSASEIVLFDLKKQAGIDFKMVVSGGLDATRTMLKTGQIDAAYTFPPYGMDAIAKKEIRVLFAGDEVPGLADVTNRVNIASVDFVTKRRAVATKFMETLDKCIDWAYANPAESVKMYAKINKIDEDIAKIAMGYYKREALAWEMKKFDVAVQRAVENKYIDKAPTAAELKELIDVVYLPPKK